MSLPDSLPTPTAQEIAHSLELQRVICTEIEQSGGAIDFSRFMELALYETSLGYYMSGRRKFGEQGDFTTASELGNVFAQCLARQCSQVLTSVHNGEILEFGAGSGALAVDLLLTLDQVGVLPEFYRILEISPDLQARQHAALSARVPQHLHRVIWMTELPKDFRGIILANEVLDALPVRRVRMEREGLRTIEVGWDKDHFIELTGSELGSDFELVPGFTPSVGYCTEVGEQRQAWIKSVAECLTRGLVLIIDYGYPRHEYYHPQRRAGTLMCHYHHRAHDDPYINVGLQDITAHVDFTALANSAAQAGLSVRGFTTQTAFLLSLGITDAIEPHMQGSTRQQMLVTQQVKKLTLPSAMGELFKVMALGKDFEAPLMGFAEVDHRGRL